MSDFLAGELSRLRLEALSKKEAKEALVLAASRAEEEAAAARAAVETQVPALEGEAKALEDQIAALDARLALISRLQNFAWKNAHGKFATGCPGGELNFDTEKRDAWENWRLEGHPDNKVALRSAHNKLLCAEADGHWVANRDGVGAWELFELVLLDDGQKFALKSCHGKYFTSHPHNNQTGSADVIDSWEKFEIHT
jgi:hypothetical protein